MDHLLLIFFSEFSDILENYISLADELVIVGDFSFHFDAPDNIHVRRFFDLLNCHGLTQHVQQPTHQDGHILDLVIDRGNACICDIIVADLISDHHAVHCQLAMRKPPFKVKDITYRKLRAIDLLSFASDIMNSDLLKKPEGSLDELVSQYGHVLSELLDKHAPLKTRTLTVRPEAPWMEESIFPPGRRDAGWNIGGDYPGSRLRADTASEENATHSQIYLLRRQNPRARWQPMSVVPYCCIPATYES